MFEDFRKMVDDSAFADQDPKEEPPKEISLDEPRFLFGLTPFQRFLVAFILLLMSIVLGLFLLLATSKIVFPVSV